MQKHPEDKLTTQTLLFYVWLNRVGTRVWDFFGSFFLVSEKRGTPSRQSPIASRIATPLLLALSSQISRVKLQNLQCAEHLAAKISKNFRCCEAATEMIFWGLYEVFGTWWAHGLWNRTDKCGRFKRGIERRTSEAGTVMFTNHHFCRRFIASSKLL